MYIRAQILVVYNVLCSNSYFIPVPSGAPLNVTVIPSLSSLVVSWQPPDCLEWNSRRLTHYTLHYHPLPPSQEEGGEEMVTGTQFTLTGLTSFTNYSVSISANNNRGMGPRSKEVFASIVTGEFE